LDEYGNALEEIRRLLDLGQTDQAARYVHTLGGLLGYVGAMDVKNQAMALETSLHGVGTDVADLVLKLESDLPEVFEALRHWLAERPRSAA
jgi:HPt (histidine-containing phosphotransfer) domain-containing protein